MNRKLRGGGGGKADKKISLPALIQSHIISKISKRNKYGAHCSIVLYQCNKCTSVMYYVYSI